MCVHVGFQIGDLPLAVASVNDLFEKEPNTLIVRADEFEDPSDALLVVHCHPDGAGETAFASGYQVCGVRYPELEQPVMKPHRTDDLPTIDSAPFDVEECRVRLVGKSLELELGRGWIGRSPGVHDRVGSEAAAPQRR